MEVLLFIRANFKLNKYVYIIYKLYSEENMKTYKYSRFNIVLPMPPNRIILYNTFSLKHRILTLEEYNNIKNSVHNQELENYIEEGFIVPSELDEIQKLKDFVKSNLEKHDFMDLSILTTLACNYRCLYCFEKDHLCNTNHMTKETADEILTFIKRRYAEHQFKEKLRIKWIGGEPVLNMQSIRYISKELKSNNIDFVARMYTNGRLLTKEIALELKELGVTGVVAIPLDGLAPTYAKMKQCKEEDFYTVVNNIKDCEDILNIRIQINVSEASKADAEILYKELRETYGMKSTIIYNRVAPINTKEINDNNSVSDEYVKKLKGDTYKVKKIARYSGCEAQNPNYYVIGPSGELYICGHLIGQEQYIVGNIKNITEQIDRTNTIWDTDKLIDDCKDCPVLPVCAYKCPTKKYIDKIDCNKNQRITDLHRLIIKLVRSKQ